MQRTRRNQSASNHGSFWNIIMNKKPTPLTDAFLESLRDRMYNLKLKKVALAEYLGKSKQAIQCWFTVPRSKSPNAESVLKIQEWEKLK